MWDKLEIEREELDREIKKKLDFSANLSFYPSRTALMEAVLADKVGGNEVTSEFVVDFIQVTTSFTPVYQQRNKSCSRPCMVKEVEAFARQ